MTKGKLIIISGPSGSGKGTVAKLLLEKHGSRIVKCPTATTRSIRPGEVDGVDHIYLSKVDFQTKQDQGEFLEAFEYDHQLYGTLRQPVVDALALGKDVLLEIDVRGASVVRQRFPDAILIFINAASSQELERQLRGRQTNTEKDIDLRLSYVDQELKAAQDEYDHIVINPPGHPEQAVAKIEKILAY